MSERRKLTFLSFISSEWWSKLSPRTFWWKDGLEASRCVTHQSRLPSGKQVPEKACLVLGEIKLAGGGCILHRSKSSPAWRPPWPPWGRDHWWPSSRMCAAEDCLLPSVWSACTLAGVDLCLPNCPQRHAGVLIPAPWECDLSGNRVFAEMIKSWWGHTPFGVCPRELGK